VEPTDWIIAGAAVASAVVAFLLWRVTRKYTTETEAIARANDRMSEANDRMANANERLIEEMRTDREVSARRASEEAAHRLQRALARVHRELHHGGLDDLDAVTRAVNDWIQATAIDSNALRSPLLRKDVARFSRILTAATMEWETVIAMIEDQQGETEAERRRRLDNRMYRIQWGTDRLRSALGAHQRGEDFDTPQLPKGAYTFLMAKPGVGDEGFEALAIE
jgi:hypothetical protein